MDGLVLQNKIYKRYAFAAKRIGVDFQLHRPISAISAIPHQISTIKASFNAKDFGYSKPNEYGKPAWYGIFDGRLTQPGDYLIASGQPTYFIAAMQLNIPIYCIECNNTITISSENLENNSSVELTPVMSGWPCSILESGTRAGGLDSPGSIGQGEFICLVPYFGVQIHTGFTITDGNGNNYIARIVELTDLGWRMKVIKVHV